MTGVASLRGWWRGHLTVRLIAAEVLALALLMAGGLGYIRLRDEEIQLARLIDKIGTALVATASLTLPDAIINEDTNLLEEYCKDVVENPDVDVVFVSVARADGKQLAAFGTLPGDPAAEGIQIVTAPALLRPEGKELGRTTIGLDVRQMQQNLRTRALFMFVQNMAASAMLAWILVVLLQRMVGRPLYQLDRQAARIGRGDLDRPVTTSSSDEFGRLAATLEHMRSNLRASHAELKEQNEQLLELDRLKDEFLANVSHEIRTPLQAILGNAHLLGEATASQQGECIGSIERNASHLLGLVNQMLDFSKLQTGNLSVERHRTDLRALLDDIAACLRPQATAKGLRLDVTMGRSAPLAALTDPLRLRQILMNLLGNALKFTDRGSVTLTALPADSGRVQFTVADTGIGIPASYLSFDLFRPFATGDASLTRKHGGAGLGLVISRELARLLGGELTIQSREGKGTTATVVITGALAEAAPTDDGAQGEDPAPLQGSVLPVDDAADTRKLLAFVLRKNGMQVTTAENGEEACRAVTSQAFDIIVMDVQMPVLDGREAALRMRTAGCKTPLVALTAHATANDRTLCLAAGFDDYATKPITPRQLVELVRRRLPARVALGVSDA